MISIIIPTCNFNNLISCYDSIVKYTDLDNVELIVVANGCDNVRSDLQNTKIIQFEQPIGYTKAVNIGLKNSLGDFIILLNDDIILLEQPKNRWIEILKNPFIECANIGITGPIKFIWDCGGINRTSIAFWCCMFQRSLVNEIGFLDENFNPGMGEDGDFSLRAELIGYRLVQVPNDGSKQFGEGVTDYSFPIYHEGNGTFNKVDMKNEIIQRNNKILEDKYASRLEKIYNIALNHECDINKLFPTLRKYACRCECITEFGVRGVFSTYAFLVAKPIKMTSYDIYTCENIHEAIDVAKENGIDFKFIEHDVLTTEIEETDLLFIDTLHTYKQLSQELTLHANKVRKYILLHDTTKYGQEDEVQTNLDRKGLQLAVQDFLQTNDNWEMDFEIIGSNGLIVLRRRPKFSIIIPTCASNDVISDCLNRVFQFTNLIDKEVIVSANGCDNAAITHLESLKRRITLIDHHKKVGVPIAVNSAAIASRGSYLILLDDDSLLLPQEVDSWISKLYEPFLNDKLTGATGIFIADYPFLGLALHSGCAMYPKYIWDQINGFDCNFGIGYLSDTDFSLRISKAGYSIVPIGLKNDFPLYHPSSPTTIDKKQKNVSTMRYNRNILYSKHQKKPKYSIVIPTYNHLEDCLKPCLDSIKKFTKLDDVEIIVVANGCKDNTADYIDSLGHPFKLIWYDDGLGFTKATNIGIKAAVGDYIILLNNDTILLDKGLLHNAWIDILVHPFLNDETVGITGPLQLYDNYAGYDVMIFFCVMIRSKVFDKIGLLDESYSPGGGEDIDFCVKAQIAGYKQVVVPDNDLIFTFTNEGRFPIYHIGEGTFSVKEFPEYSTHVIKVNGMKNMLRYNKHIKLNLGSGGVEFPGYISVDKYDMRALIIADVYELDLPENSVEEILASHLLEHINPYKVVEVLNNWKRILKPGGKLVIEVPNIEELCKMFVTADKKTRYGILNCFFCPVNTTDKGGQGDITSPHLWGWYPEMLWDHLTWAGFTDIQIMPEQIPHPLINFRAEAKKSV